MKFLMFLVLLAWTVVAAFYVYWKSTTAFNAAGEIVRTYDKKLIGYAAIATGVPWVLWLVWAMIS